jgi:hypothetical protein
MPEMSKKNLFQIMEEKVLMVKELSLLLCQAELNIVALLKNKS